MIAKKAGRLVISQSRLASTASIPPIPIASKVICTWLAAPAWH